MEEQRQRQQDEARRTQGSSDTPAAAGAPSGHEGMIYSDHPNLFNKFAMFTRKFHFLHFHVFILAHNYKQMLQIGW